MPDEPDDEGAAGLPPDPLDRVWFHPSELGAPPAPPQRTGAGRDWGVAFLGAVCGIVATLGVLAATGTIDSGGSGDPATAGLAPVFARLQSDRAADLVSETAPSVVAVRGDGVAAGGSGVAFGTDRVVTSAAVVTGATGITVTTSRSRVLPATLAGVDPETDLALLRVDDGHLPLARLGSADGVAVGTWVLAVGASGGERRWASQGVVSGVSVLVTTPDGTSMPGMLATDVAPSTEAAGGPLLNDDGAVVAILSGVAPGHALPVDVAREVAEQLSASGRVRHAWLGVDAADTRARAGGGVTVMTVTPGGPAEQAGIAVGDVITELGDDRVADLGDLLAAVAHRRPGDPVELTVWRADHRLHRPATLAERP
ncbi:MAG TPA: trypsin-like peptidase domain-containing protein [Acidimicrobiia bacterium]